MQSEGPASGPQAPPKGSEHLPQPLTWAPLLCSDASTRKSGLPAPRHQTVVHGYPVLARVSDGKRRQESGWRWGAWEAPGM